MTKPLDMFDRDIEWGRLTEFATDDRPGATLGIVYGRRRQGKSFLLSSLAEETNGCYFEATQDVRSVILSRLGAVLGRFVGSPAPLALPDWQAAIDAIFRLGRDRPVTVVLDEFPYLLAESPELPSMLQVALGPRSTLRTASRTRLVLCGSALNIMAGLLTAQAPLRGRSSLELPVHTFNFRDARRYWGTRDLKLSVMLHAVVGGTPAYKEMLRRVAPQRARDFDEWVCRHVLDPASPLQREGEVLFDAEMTGRREAALYHSVLSAVAEGKTKRGQIAAHVQRATSDLARPLDVLVQVGFLRHEEDIFKSRNPTWTLRDPLMAFYYAVMRPVRAKLERTEAVAAAWRQQRDTFSSRILGSHFEQMCRDWAAWFAAPETFAAETIDQVGHGIVPGGRGAPEVDVVVRARGRIVALGEAKWGEELGLDHFSKLAKARERLPGAERARLIFFSADSRFSRGLRERAEAGDAVLVGLDRLYDGD